MNNGLVYRHYCKL